MWHVVRRGISFEVPISLDRHDLSYQAVVELQKQHPEVELRMHQSRGVIVGLAGRRSITRETQGQLERGQYYPGAEKERSNIDTAIAGHEAFLHQQGLDPAEMEREAQEERMRAEAIAVTSEVTASSESAPAASAPATGDNDVTH